MEFMKILNFHGVGPLVRDVDPGEYACWLDTEHFEAILDCVLEHSNILITFDDGNASDYDIVLPALMRRGMRAVFFVCSGRVGKQTFLNADQVRELSSQGMAIGSHGIHHRPWRTLGRTELQDEVAGSRMALEDACGKSVDLAACPFGSYDWRVLRVLKKCGYRAVYTSDGGDCKESQWLRARTTIKRSFSVAEVQQMIQHRPPPARRLVDGIRISLKRLRFRGCSNYNI